MAARATAPASVVDRPVNKVPYLPGLDGLRAIAVMAVLAYHAEVSGWQGGFLGVEVFFAISGYLITSILLAQWRNSGSIDFKTFYRRRALRLLPALIAVLVGTTLISVIFLPDEVATLRGDVVSALTYVTNWFFIVGQKSYFESAGRPSLVQHLWSLAVEEQFYLVWPVLFALGIRRLGERRLLAAVLAGAFASTVLMFVLYRPGTDPTRVYYGTDTRAAALLIGAALAMVWEPFRLRRKVGFGAPVVLDAIGVASLVALVALLYGTDQFADALYRGGFLRVSVVTAVLIAVTVHPAAHLGRTLGVRPLRWLGLRSYGIYLYHWPIFQLTRPGLDTPLTGTPLLALRLGLTLALATLSYRYLETPIRSGAFSRAVARWRHAAPSRQWLLGLRWGVEGAAAITALSILVMVVVHAQTPPTPAYLLAGSGGTEIADPGFGTVPVPTAALAAPPPGVGVITTVASTIPRAGDGATSSVVPSDAPSSVAPVPAAPLFIVPPATGVPVTPAGPVLEISALGDSVMLGAGAALRGALQGETHIDARVNRQVSEGLDILRSWRDQGAFGDVVVIDLGNNGTFNEQQFAEMRDLLAGVPRVVFVDVKVPRRWEGSVNQVLADGVATMSNAVLVDWKSEGDAHPEYFVSDGIHLSPEGAARFAQMINAEL